MKLNWKRMMMTALSLALVFCLAAGSAQACTTIYVGAAMSADGAVILGRSEDYSNSQNKLFYVAQAGKHSAGEEYAGCYGFTWTFNHDSYGYTAFSDDNGEGVDYVCPDCGQDHPHTPYEAAGTNDQGVTITATETIYGDEALEAVDPFEDLGIEEAEIVTVLLSEAATAREAVDLLLGIYDEAGANSGSGILIADSGETWYVENVTGHQYIALKLSDTMVMIQPNMSIIGAIDLDDAEHVIASPGLIETAVQAGTFVGDEGENVINYVLSYNVETSANARMADGLAYLDAAYAGAEAIDPAAYLISNVDGDGNIVPMYSGIHPAQKLGIADVQNFYHIGSIGYQRNLEGHIFQIAAQGGMTGTVEWVCMNDNALSVFVPYYPMLTADVSDAYKKSTATAEFVQEEPESGLYYPATVNRWIDGARTPVDGYMVLPDNWADSMYWAFDALSNLVLFGGLDEAVKDAVYAAVYEKQAAVNEAFAALNPEGLTAADATAFSMAQAQEVYQMALDLVAQLTD